MPMQGTTEGEDITPEECLKSGVEYGVSKRKIQGSPAPGGKTSSAQCGDGPGGVRTPAEVKKRIVAVSTLPHLRREHYRIIVRPRGGMNVKNVSQIKVAQSLALAAQLDPAEIADDIVCSNVMQNIFVLMTNYEVSSYLAAPDNTYKGVVRGVDLDFDAGKLKDIIVQPKNPRALERQKRDRSRSPSRGRFEGPRSSSKNGHSRSTERSRCRGRSRSKGLPAVRIQEPPEAEQTTWVDRVKGLTPRVMGVSSTPPAHSAASIVQQERENAFLSNAFEQLKAQKTEMKSAENALPARRPLPPETAEVATPIEPEAPVIVKPAKKRSKSIRDEGLDELRAELKELQSELRTTLETISEAVFALNERVESTHLHRKVSYRVMVALHCGRLRSRSRRPARSISHDRVIEDPNCGGAR
ncbi:hypothetical protein HPB48_021238 [Haemaphysalis longicornis]|uniref:Uncharacterized protein n=1 Tax=Haemaphysalis longicornis TaxID=44386 RepID=A0A9J6F9C0_HAELO|nr:hypothetical protein HPB48_021238 [Haemaphysalis longicornis]